MKNLNTNFTLNNCLFKSVKLSKNTDPFYNGSMSFLFVNATKTYQFKAKNSEIKEYILFLRNNITNNNTKKQD